MFELLEKRGNKRLGKITTVHGEIYTPAFGPDATRGIIKNITPHELEKLNPLKISTNNQEKWHNNETQFILTNTYHIRSFPGDEFINEMGGIHSFMKWSNPILTDSGGFQVFSLIHKAKNLKGKVTDDGAFFNNPINGTRLELTPEKAIDIQFNLGSDIIVCLDDCRHYKDDKELKMSVYRTIEWAKRCKAQFEKNLETYKPLYTSQSKIPNTRPLLFCVIQGGIDFELRKFCVDEMIKIGFDGYGFGGWAINEKEYFPYDLLEFVAQRLPEDKPRYAMGVGTPENMIQCIEYGYDLFDCVIPSRNARHGLCYTTDGIVKILNAQYKRDKSILDKELKTAASDYEKYYLHHLFKIGDAAGGELLTLHNLAYYNYTMRRPFLD